MSARLVWSRVLAALGMVAFAVTLGACSQETVDAKLRSLQASSEVTFVCRGPYGGTTREHCPDRDHRPSQTVLDALVTQTATDEIAIVNASLGGVVDVDLSVPGYNFLRLPSRPGDIVTTPGGTASFVGLTTSGRTGISALPTDCLGPPREPSQSEGIRQAPRDVTTFPACTLPSTPGDMAVIVEPPAPDGTIAESCADPATPQSSEPPGGTRYHLAEAADADACHAIADEGGSGLNGVWVGQADGSFECRVPNGRDCASNLTTEGGPPGRRKLVVALPDEGRLVVLDAQAILDRKPGSFDPCVIDSELSLEGAVDASGQKQSVPPELEPPAGCNLAMPTPPPLPAGSVSRPAGLAVADSRLFVGDLGVPLVHEVDTSSICKPREAPALLPMSFVHPERIVTTSRVAVTPVTPAGKQYVYAVDVNDQPTSSVMVFDVSPGVTDRTPLVRTGSARQPREAADRLQFPAPVGDLTFALRDIPASDLTTGVAEDGVECDPDPTLPLDPPPPGAQYRTSADRTQGARPRLLRGLFGLVLLTNGQVYVVDVDDFDRKCRRAVQANTSSTPDFRGCANDPDVGYFTYSHDSDGALTTGDPNGIATVSNEVSCNMVEPHRTRSAAFGLADPSVGVGAPSLRALPRFQPPPYSAGSKTNERPKLLAVPFEAPDGGAGVPPEVYVGTTLYRPTSDSARLPTAPDPTEDSNGIALPPAEPRSYLANDHNAVTYEGRVVNGDFPSGFFDLSGLSLDTNGVLADPTAFYCGNGVYDEAAMASYASDVLGLSEKQSAAFARGDDDDLALGHADYVQITGDFPSIIDPYWQSARGLSGGGRQACIDAFGQPPGQAQDLETARDFRIIEAYQDHLVIRPRNPPQVTADPNRYIDPSPERDQEQQLFDDQTAARDAYPEKIKEAVAYCFPSGVRYTVRGSHQWVLANGTPSWLHDTVVDYANGGRCVRDCNPRKRWFRNRVFELATVDACGQPQAPSADACAASGVGPGTPADGPCRYDPTMLDGQPVATRGVVLGEPGGADKCIFENLTSRFAMYRGQQPSVRDMSFVWDQTGGFYVLTGSLATQSVVTLPQHLAYVPEYESIAIVNGASLGLSFMTLDSLTVQDPWPVY